MTNDAPHSGDHPSLPGAPVVADAAASQVPVRLLAKVSLETDAGLAAPASLPSTNYARLEARMMRGGAKARGELRDARAIVETALAALATEKNVGVTPTLFPELVDVVLGTLTPALLAGFVRSNPDCVTHAATAMNHALDMVAAAHFIRIMRFLGGWDEDDALMGKHSRHWTYAMPANDCPDIRWRWPTSQDFIATYNRARNSGPVSIRFPGAVRAAYQFDPAFAPTGSTPYPPIVRCRAAPGNIGFVMDGHWCKPQPGGVLETWWRNGDLHRDPSEGPAVIARDENGATLGEQYWVHGRQQPAPEANADG